MWKVTMDPHFPFNLPSCNDYGSSYPEISFGPPTPRMSSSPPLRSLEYPCLPSILKPRNITSPENKPVQEKGADTTKAQPLYKQILAMVKQLEKDCPERPISITLSSRDFQKLMNDLKYSESDQK